MPWPCATCTVVNVSDIAPVCEVCATPRSPSSSCSSSAPVPPRGSSSAASALDALMAPRAHAIADKRSRDVISPPGAAKKHSGKNTATAGGGGGGATGETKGGAGAAKKPKHVGKNTATAGGGGGGATGETTGETKEGAASSSTPASGDAALTKLVGHRLTGVEAAGHAGKAHCGFCDLRVESDCPRVVRFGAHAPSNYSRNGGETTGTYKGGNCSELMHPQCALRVAKVKTKTGALCSSGCDDGRGGRGRCGAGEWHFKCVFSKPIESSASRRRCNGEASSIWLCRGCVRSFVRDNRDALAGHLGERSQFDTAVAWENSGSTQQPMLFGGVVVREGPQGKACSELRAAFSGIFTEEEEAAAVERHVELQATIGRSM